MRTVTTLADLSAQPARRKRVRKRKEAASCLDCGRVFDRPGMSRRINTTDYVCRRPCSSRPVPARTVTP